MIQDVDDADSAIAIVDIGANLSHPSFHHDRDQVISAARAAGVQHIIVTGTDLESIIAARQLADQYKGYLTLTAGFHPHVATQFDSQALAQLSSWLSEPSIVAVGETGLDFNRDFSPRDIQEKVFAQQLELAVNFKKPVFLHQRDAHGTFLGILNEYRDSLTSGVVHCFTDNQQALFDYLDLDMYIGITGWICDERRGRDLQELVSSIPENRLLIETDSPYLLPRTLQPMPKVRRNEPRYLPEILKMLSHCTGRSVVTLARQTRDNSMCLFGIDPGA